MDKEYYTLGQLEKRLDLSVDDLAYYMDNHDLHIYLFCENERFVLGGWLKEKGFIGYGTGSYRGLLKIDRTTQINLVNKEKVQVCQSWLMDKTKVTLWDATYPFQKAYPNNVFFDWSAKALLDIPFEAPPAYFKHNQHKPYLKVMQSMAAEVSSEQPEQQDSEHNHKPVKRTSSDEKLGFMDVIDGIATGVVKYAEEVKKKADSEELEIAYRSKQFSLADIRIFHNDLFKVGLLNSPYEKNRLQEGVTTSVVQPTPENKQIDTREDQSTELIRRILERNLNFKAVDVWKAIESDAKRDFDERVYDVEGIIRDMTQNEVMWESRYGAKASFNFSSFGSKVSKVRSKYGLRKHNK